MQTPDRCGGKRPQSAQSAQIHTMRRPGPAAKISGRCHRKMLMSRIPLLLLAAAFGALCVWLIEATGNQSAERLRIRASSESAIAARSQMPLPEIAALSELRHAHAPASEFWRRDAAAQRERMLRILAAERRARAALTASFGPDIAEAAAFWPLFRPLEDRMPELTSHEQITIHELELRFFANTAAHDAAMSFSEHLSKVEKRLGAAIANEYALRSSPSAHELREAGFDLSESEFRSAVTALRAIGEAMNPGDFAAARSALQEQLGSRQFAQLWAARDPRFREIESTARRLGLTEETTMTAWALLLEHQDAMLRNITAAHPNARQERARRQYEADRRRLIELVGQRAADALLAAAARPPQTSPD